MFLAPCENSRTPCFRPKCATPFKTSVEFRARGNRLGRQPFELHPLEQVINGNVRLINKCAQENVKICVFILTRQDEPSVL